MVKASLPKPFRIINYVFLLLIVISIPFAKPFVSWWIIGLILNRLAGIKYNWEPVNWRTQVGFGLLFPVYVLGYFWSGNHDNAAFEIEKKLGLLLFPLLAGCFAIISEKDFKTLLLVFVGTCTLLGLYCFTMVLPIFLQSHKWSDMQYFKLVNPIDGHAGYFAMYCTFSVFVLINYLAENHLGNLKRNLVPLLVLIFLLIFNLLLSSRAELIALGLISAGQVLVLAYQKNRMKEGVLILVLFLSCLAGGVFFNQTNRSRFLEAINYKNRYSIENYHWGGRAMRMLKWECCNDLIRASPFVGYGTGDVQDHLQACYTAKKFYPLTLFGARYNAHNQYFETMLAIGLPGLLSLLLALGTGIYVAKNKKNFLLFCFIILFAFCCLTESMLNNLAGVVFYTFFNSLLAFGQRRKLESENNQQL